MAYDEKFRRRVIEYKEGGHTFKEMNGAFGVDSGRYYCWKKQLAETGSLKYRPPKNRERKINKEELLRMAAKHPDWYLREFAEAFNVCHQAIQQMFKKLGVARKKKRSLVRRSRKINGRII